MKCHQHVCILIMFYLSGHMAEETRGASSSAPIGMVTTVLMSSFVGLSYIFGLLSSTAQDVEGYVSNKLEPTNIFFR